jgi:DNA-directed RNA polymerase subunit B
VNNLSLSASISVSANSDKAKQLLYRLGVISIQDANEEIQLNGTKVFVDGCLVGFSTSPSELVTELRRTRRKGEVSSEVNVAYFSKIYGEREEIYVNCDGGRVRRPLIIVENGIPKLEMEHIARIRSGEWSWENLTNGIVELIDAEEEENVLVALTPQDVTPDQRLHPTRFSGYVLLSYLIQNIISLHVIPMRRQWRSKL